MKIKYIVLIVLCFVGVMKRLVTHLQVLILLNLLVGTARLAQRQHGLHTERRCLIIIR